MVGQECCHERFVRVRRPMFHRAFVRGDAVLALPRRGTKTAGAVAFELSHGREIEIGTLPAGESTDRARLDYLSSPVGRGPSQLRLFAGRSEEPLRTIEVPDAISGVAEAPYGWYVGCRDGFLYAFDRAGDLVWRWRTPGAAAFHSSGPGDVYFRPSPYRLASNGHSVLVGWWGSLWSVSPNGETEWGLRLTDLCDRHVTEIRRRVRDAGAADAAALGVRAHASPPEIKRAYREAVKRAHPDLHPDDATATERFRRVQEAYESLSGHGTVGGSGTRVIRFDVPSAATVSFLDAVDGNWLVGSSGGMLFRLSSQGRLLGRVRIASGAVLPVRDSSRAVVGFSSQPVVNRSQPNLWFVDAPAPVRLPNEYPWPDHILGSYGNYLLAHRARGRDLGLIDESGRLAVQLRCPRPISSVCVAEGTLLLTAGALVCIEIDGLSPLTRARIWRPPFTRSGYHEPQTR